VQRPIGTSSILRRHRRPKAVWCCCGSRRVHELAAAIGALPGAIIDECQAWLSDCGCKMHLFQFSLNRAWKVRSDSSGLRGFLGKRISSFGMLMALSLVVVGTTVASSWVGVAGRNLPIPAWAARLWR
jgi:hypothetical protein